MTTYITPCPDPECEMYIFTDEDRAIFHGTYSQCLTFMHQYCEFCGGPCYQEHN